MNKDTYSAVIWKPPGRIKEDRLGESHGIVSLGYARAECERLASIARQNGFKGKIRGKILKNGFLHLFTLDHS